MAPAQVRRKSVIATKDPTVKIDNEPSSKSSKTEKEPSTKLGSSGKRKTSGIFAYFTPFSLVDYDNTYGSSDKTNKINKPEDIIQDMMRKPFYINTNVNGIDVPDTVYSKKKVRYTQNY